MDKKLEEYRKRKKREELLSKTKEKLKSFFVRERKSMDEVKIPLKSDEETFEVSSTVSSDSFVDDDSLNCFTFKDLIRYGVYFTLWATLYYVFIQYQFGIVYFLVSCLVGMYLNTRTGPKLQNEVSAYSVFNENCKSIDGTLKGEQFEREMGYRM